MKFDIQSRLSRLVASTIRSVPFIFLIGMLSISGAAQAQTATGVNESSSIERGRYLATAGNCKACHTTEGNAPFAGGLAFNTDFGLIYSSNITPEANAGIGGWTEEQFVRAMRTGKSADGSRLYPAFPYPFFTKLSEQHITDLFAYLKSVTPSSYTPPSSKLSFPFNLRSLLGVWNAMNLKTGAFEPDETQSDEWNRGAYLVEALSHCGACHTPRSSLGGLKRKLALSGGSYNDKVATGEIRRWSAINLTSAPDGLALWTEDDIASYLKTGHSSVAGTFGPMNKVIELSTSQMSDSDVRAMAVYLKSLPPIERAREYKMPDKEFRQADVLYTIHCGTCHLPTGLGDSSTGTPLAGSAIVQSEDPSSLINVIIYGATVPSTLAPPGAWQSMEAFGDKLSDEEIALLSTYLRSNWGNRGGRVSEKEVAKQR